MGLIGNKITPNYGSKVKDRKTLGGLRFSWENFAISIFFHIAKAMLADKAIITSYDLNTLHPAPQVRNLPCIAKYLYYCRNDPFENVVRLFNWLAMQMLFYLLVVPDQKGPWLQILNRSALSFLTGLDQLNYWLFIMCNSSHFFCQIKYCKHLQRQSRARLLQLSELECDIFWQKLNSQVYKSLLFPSHQIFSPFSPGVSFLYCLPFCFDYTFFQIAIIYHLLVREAFDS